MGDHHAYSGFRCKPPHHIVFVGDVQKSPIASHLRDFDPSLSSAVKVFTGINEGG